jgi:hypothetical protein
MQQRACPECGAAMGGMSHTLAAGNVQFDPRAVAATD